MKKFISALSVLLVLAACAPEREGSATYSEFDVGKSTKVEFGRIISVRKIKVKADENSGVGAAAGLAAGGLAGSNIGNSSGNTAAIVGGALIGAIVGTAVEKKIHGDRDAIEYVVARDDGDTVSVAQNLEDDVPVMKVGQRVMVQIKGISGKGTYMRVLPADGVAAPAQHHKKKKHEDKEEAN